MIRDKVIFGSWRALTFAAFPLLLLYVLWRIARDRSYGSGLAERVGLLPRSFRRTAPGAVWLHAVSAGEVLSAIPLIRELRETMPGTSIFVTTGTRAGRDAAEARLSTLVEGISFAPFDVVWCVRRFLRTVRPAAVVVLETEIWPNLFREVRNSDCALIVVNGRISNKTHRTYARFRWFFASVLRQPDALLVQSAEDARRYASAGAPQSKIHVNGNLKYDFDPARTRIPDVVSEWAAASGQPVWIAASTVAPEFDGDTDEDDAVIAAWRELPGTRLIVAPRKPDRFEVVARKWADAGVRIARRSQLPDSVVSPVLLLDTIGELGSVFPLGQVVFMGGTLARRGGHNILEPALFGCPVVCGPHLENFADIEQRFEDAEALERIAAPSELRPAIHALLTNPARRRRLGERGRDVAAKERGAAVRAAALIAEVRYSHLPRSVPYPGAILLSACWRAGGRLKRRLTTSRRLHTPVISVGGIAMGGSGKTPLVRELAADLHAAGYVPTVLTRGYRRRSDEAVTLLAAGSEASAAQTGDEPATILKDGHAHLAIGSDRYEAGRRAEERFHPDVFLMDDGFQHARLERVLDIVVLDGTDPFAGGALFPAGWQREGVEALSRCHAIVISRADTRMLPEIRKRLPSGLPVFASTLHPACWVDLQTGSELPVPSLAGRQVVAFCGLANPDSFRRTLAECAVHVVDFLVYPDHHWFTQAEIRELRDRSAHYTLVTTDKDATRLPRMAAYALIVRSVTPGLSAAVKGSLPPRSVTQL